MTRREEDDGIKGPPSQGHDDRPDDGDTKSSPPLLEDGTGKEKPRCG